MKIFAIITGTVLLMLTGLIGYQRFSAYRAQEAIANALADQEHAYRENIVRQEQILGPPIKKLRVNQFISDLLKIDTKDCPSDFRAAWVNYVQSYERTQDLIFTRQQKLLENNTKLIFRAEIGTQIGGAYESEHSNNLLAARHLARIDHKEKLLTLERIAFHYGVEHLRHYVD